MVAIRPAVAADYELVCQLFSLLDSFHARLLPHIFQETDCHVRPYHYIADLIEQPDAVLFGSLGSHGVDSIYGVKQ